MNKPINIDNLSDQSLDWKKIQSEMKNKLGLEVYESWLKKISFVEEMPVCTWNEQAPNEYGFYSNVNPYVDHPRWSQKRERRIGEFGKRDTLLFNGYSKFVSNLYTGMDLEKEF